MHVLRCFLFIMLVEILLVSGCAPSSPVVSQQSPGQTQHVPPHIVSDGSPANTHTAQETQTEDDESDSGEVPEGEVDDVALTNENEGEGDSQLPDTTNSVAGIDIKTSSFDDCVKYFTWLYDDEQGLGKLMKKVSGAVDISFDQAVTLQYALTRSSQWGSQPAVLNGLPALYKGPDYDTDEEVFDAWHIIRIQVPAGQEITVACTAVKQDEVATAYPAVDAGQK